MKRFLERTAKLKPIFDELESPLQKHLELVKEINSLVDDKGQAAMMAANELDKLIGKLGIAPEQSAFQQYLKNVENIETLRRQNLIDDLRMTEMLGQQVSKLAASQKELADAGPPEALMRGSAADFSAINAFQRGQPDSKKDAAAIIAQAAKEQAERDAEQIRLGKEANRHLAKFANIEAMGP